MKTFDDLVFENHPVVDNALASRLSIGEYSISIGTMKGKQELCGSLYGSQLAGTYEVAVFRKTPSGGSEMIRLCEWDDILAGQTAEQITAIMKTIQEGNGSSLNHPVPAW